jgi:hypothetical protein
MTRRGLLGATLAVLVVTGWQAPAMGDTTSVECLADLAVW